MALQDEGKHAEALECFQKATEINPHFIPAWVYQGIALEQLGKYEEAIARYSKAIEINPNVADLWYNKGVTLSNLRRHSEALACFNTVLQIDPHNAIAQTARALTLAVPPNPIELPNPAGSPGQIRGKEAKEAIKLSETKQKHAPSQAKEIELGE
jgi:tetratricopeptide (TPR) repeat protein